MTCDRCEDGYVERLATPEEVDAGCELGIAFDPCPHCAAKDAVAEFHARRCPDCGMMPHHPLHEDGCPDGPLWEPTGSSYALEAAHMSYHWPTIRAEEEASRWLP